MTNNAIPYYREVAEIIEQNKQTLSSGEIATLILEFLEMKKSEEEKK